MCITQDRKHNIDLITFITLSIMSIGTIGACLTFSFLDDDPAQQPRYWGVITFLLGWWVKTPGSIVPKLSSLFVKEEPQEPPTEAIQIT